MKKIISGKVYDTSTAVKIGNYETEVDDGALIFAGLYRKRNGEYFAESGGTVLGMTQTITPLSYDEAREWTEEHLDSDTYITFFGNPDEGDDDNLARLQVRVPERIIAAIDREVSRSGRTRSDIVTELLGKALGM